MAHIKSIGLQNMRRLRHIDPNIRLAPITVLLGRNSVGKSTFARVFPLLRQSSERRKRSPVLWFGDLVDFGSIGKAISEGENSITFSFELELTESEATRTGSIYGRSQPSTVPNSLLRHALIQLTLAEDTDKSGYAKKLKVEAYGGSIEIDLPLQVREGNQIKINGVDQIVPKDYLLTSFQGDFLPLLAFYKKRNDANGQPVWSPTASPLIEAAAQAIKWSVHGNTSTATARRIASQIPLGTPQEIESAIRTISGPVSWTTYVGAKHTREFLVMQLHRALMAAHAGSIIQQLDSALKTYFAGVKYLKPLRAVAERYYRRVDLSVSEIDPEGRNLPLFLDSLSPYLLTSFRDWLKKYLEIDAYPVREGDQLMVMAQGRHDNKPFNVADMGFGISQVLPIAAQLWATLQRVRNFEPATVVVLEQPELHLHPEFQARLADVFAGTVRDAGNDKIPIIIETHSQQIVNRLGQLVEAGELSPSDVSILLFESTDDEKATTRVRIAEFDSAGILKNWPFGFFEPEIR